jgi:hypothetical protein
MKADLNKIQNVKEPEELYFDVEGKKVEFRFDMGTMIELEELTGETLSRNPQKSNTL